MTHPAVMINELPALPREENDLQKPYTGPQGRQMTLDRILQILLGHEIGHRSQMLLMRRLQHPDR